MRHGKLALTGLTFLVPFIPAGPAFGADAASETQALPPETRRALYLIFKEALTNIQKHAPATAHIQVSLHAHRPFLTLAIAERTMRPVDPPPST